MSILDLVPFRPQRRSRPPARRNISNDPVAMLEQDVNRAFDSFWNMVSFPMSSRDVLSQIFDEGTGDIRTDVSDAGDQVVITAEIPGVREDDVEVMVDPQSVTIRAKRTNDREERAGDTMLHERSFGLMERTIPLPPGVLADAASARMKDGVLTIAIPKSAAAQPQARKIPIQAN